jgi:hypothetical protein
MKDSKSKIRLRYGILIGVFLALLSLYPQIYLKFQRGENYNGATFYYDYDEVIYAAYLQALIDGRPRKNDVYTGNGAPQKNETFMTIQFVGAYLVAFPARIFGASSDSAFLFVSIICAFLTSLTLFWFIEKLTENSEFAAVATLFILLFGTGAAGYGILKETFGLGSSSFYLLFLRRFTPAIAFPFLFVLLGNAWLAFNNYNKAKFVYASVVGICFAVMLYSYFYLWTAILAWLVLINLLCLIFKTENRKAQLLKFCLPVSIFLLSGLAPYYFLLSDRSQTTDSSQILEQTRAFVWWRPTLILGCGILLATLVLIKSGWLNLKEQLTLFVISFSVLPLFVFNQQVITGYSLQPMHYNMYVLNYLVLLALCLLIHMIWKENLQKVKSVYWIIFALLLFGWGVIEMHYTTYNRYWYNMRRDEAIMVNRRMAEIAKEDFKVSTSRITLNFDEIQADNQPTIAPQAILWSEHLFFLSNMSAEEHHRRYFLYLYYQNKDENWLNENLQNCPNEVCRALLGWGVNPTLSINSQKSDKSKILRIVNEYDEFLKNFSHLEASNPVISYLVIPNDGQNDFTKVDLWYERSAEEKFGNFTLYQVKLKTQ